MPLRATVIIAATAAAIGLMGPGTADAAGQWPFEVMVTPGGYEDSYFAVTATDGKGGFAGFVSIYGSTETDLLVWTGSRVDVVRNPLECTDVRAVDEDSAGEIAVTAKDCLYSGGQVYLYDRLGFHHLGTLGPYGAAVAVAMNPNGDVLGQVSAGGEGYPDAAVVWRHGVVDPVLIPYTRPGQYPVDIDIDGSVLFKTDAGAAIWRNGKLTSLAKPRGLDHIDVHAIRRGIVVGSASHADSTGRTAFWWPTPGTPMMLTGAKEAVDINSSGLIVGDLMTWQKGKPAGTLQAPYEGPASATKVGDDGVVIGKMETFYNIVLPVTWVNASR
jgi:hypothetical protein